MEQNKYEATRNSFFNSYKSFIDYIILTHDEFSKFSILVFKKNTYNNLSKVNIIIRNIHNNDDLYNEYYNSVVLSKDEAKNLINDIRNDFKDNHYISYSVINPETYIQTLRNVNFSLNIKLNNEIELKEALNFNTNINNKKHRVLQKNI